MSADVAHLLFADVEHGGKFCGGCAFFVQIAHSFDLSPRNFGSRVGVVYAAAVLVDADSFGLYYAHFEHNEAAFPWVARVRAKKVV